MASEIADQIESKPGAAASDGGTLRIVRRPWHSRPDGLWSFDLALTTAFIFVVFLLGIELLASIAGLVVPLRDISGNRLWIAKISLSLICLGLLFLWYRRALATAYDAQWRSILPRRGYLIEQHWPEAPVVSGVLKSQLLREGNPGLAMPSVLPTPEQNHHFNLAKWPISFPRAIRTWFVTLPWIALRVLFNKLARNRFASTFADDDVIRFVESTSGTLFCELMPDGCTLRLAIPEQLPVRTWDDKRIAGFELWMDTDARKITRCTFEGRSLLGDNELIFSIVIIALTHWLHAKGHLMCEQSTLEIERRQIRALAPSARFTLALHDGLINGSNSPLGGVEAPLTATGVLKEPVLAALKVEMPHYIDERKHRYRFYSFLAKARVEMILLLRKHALPISPEAAFNNMVVHPVDHAEGKKVMRGHIWSVDMSGRFTSYLRSQFFAEVIAGPLTNPMVTERLCDLDPVAHPFYAELYEKLRAIDPGYADEALTSCSF